MKNNKKGLSTIVATLLIILLTLVAVGIIWIVVRNVIQGGADQVDIDAKCLSANVEATRVENLSLTGLSTNYNVTIYRNGGDDPIGGVKLVFSERDGSENQVEPWALNVPASVGAHDALEALGARTVGPFTISLNDPNKVSVVVYFLDGSGNEQLCSTANQYTFA